MAHCRKTQLSVLLNNFCNLKCKYCFVGRENLTKKLEIELDFAKRGILDFFNSYSSREIRFFAAGEPTLSFKRMQEISNWVKHVDGGDCSFELQTNGYFSRNIANWIGSNIDICWISCDGMPDVQNYYRPTKTGKSTSEIIERNIKFLASQSIVLGCRATISACNVSRQVEMINYFHQLGVRVVMSDPLFIPISNNLSDSKDKIDLMNYAKNFLEARRHAEEIGIFYGSIFTVNFDEKTNLFCRACVPYPHLLPDGYVSCCDMATSGSDQKMSDLVYGKYEANSDTIIYDQNKIKQIQNRTAQNMPFCHGCEVLYNCAGACLGEALNETGSIFGIKPQVCDAIKYLAKNMPLNTEIYPFLHP